MRKKSKFYRLNQYITVPNLRVIGQDGKQIGILPRLEALDKARELETDLVEIAPNANPPVAKLIDFKKFKYLENKKARETKKGIRESETKEIRMGPFTDEHDLENRLVRAREFLKDGHKLRLVIKFSGREMAHPEFGRDLLAKFIENLRDLAKIEREPHFEGRLLTTILSPIR